VKHLRRRQWRSFVPYPWGQLPIRKVVGKGSSQDFLDREPRYMNSSVTRFEPLVMIGFLDPKLAHLLEKIKTRSKTTTGELMSTRILSMRMTGVFVLERLSSWNCRWRGDHTFYLLPQLSRTCKDLSKASMMPVLRRVSKDLMDRGP
jgi:hypothetical protein